MQPQMIDGKPMMIPMAMAGMNPAAMMMGMKKPDDPKKSQPGIPAMTAMPNMAAMQGMSGIQGLGTYRII